MKLGSSSYLKTGTIIAVATALPGPIGIIRISGENAKSYLLQLTKSEGELEHRKFFRTELKNLKNEKIDEGMACFFKSPQSYTGEDVAEIHFHGSHLIAKNLIQTLLALGARQALPGEFSFRAVQNGKMALSQATAVSDLIQATNPVAALIALEKMSGFEVKTLTEFTENLKDLLLKSEVGIDFSDQEIDELDLRTLKQKLKALIEQLDQWEKSYFRGDQIQNGVPTAIVGPPNAGKSSLFNLFCGEERAIISEIPGTTRDVLRETITLNHQGQWATLRFSDTAGLRRTGDVLEQEGIERSKRAIQYAKTLLVVVDPSENPIEHSDLIRTIEKKENVLLVLNKCDLLRPGERDFAEEWVNLVSSRCPGMLSCRISVKTREGIEDLFNLLFLRLGPLFTRVSQELILTREEEYFAVVNARKALCQAVDAQDHTLLAHEVRQSIFALAPLMGEYSNEELLGKIFSTFCIGK